MAKIKIKHFGPIKHGYEGNGGWMEIKKNTFFTGNQGSGKSTAAKLISTLSWLEKSMNRGDTDEGRVSFAKFEEFTSYQKIKNYFLQNTYIEYIGERYHIKYDKSEEYPIIKDVPAGNYNVPKIMYVPAERNFLSTIGNAFNIKGLPDNVFTFAEELKRAQKALNGEKIGLQIGNYKYEYDEEEEDAFVLGDNYRINILEASSGLQSFVPLYLVSRNLSMSITEKEEIIRKNMSPAQSVRMNDEIAELMLDKSTPDNEKTNKMDLIRSRYYNKCFFNIVEEPEQNLFPASQWEMLKSLLEFNNRKDGNSLLITTHSPYIINFLSLAVKGFGLYKKCVSKKLESKLTKIIPRDSTINPNKLAIYEFDENKGTIKKLDDYKGLPSDENYLNNYLGELNNLFIHLLEIEDQCQ